MGYGTVSSVAAREQARLRCYSVVNRTSELVSSLRFEYSREYDKRSDEDKARMERLLAFIRRADGNPSAAKELEELVRRHLDPGRQVEELEELYRELSSPLAELRLRLEELN
jgi:hypothetical protein